MKNIHILSISQFEEADLDKEFYVSTIENHIKQTHLHINTPHKHDFYVTILFCEGTGHHEIDFESYEIKPGSMFFINPGQVHNWKLSDNISGHIIFHTQSFFEKDFTTNHIQKFPFFNFDNPKPVLYLDYFKIEYFKKYFESLHLEIDKNEIFKADKIKTLIHLLYIDSSREYFSKQIKSQQHQHTYARQFKEFQKNVELFYKTNKSATFYSDKLNISPKHLNRICQTVIGKTTTEYIIERVLLEAKREIIHQKKSLSEIAFDLGYDDYAYFSRIFKKHFKENPSEFINKYR